MTKPIRQPKVNPAKPLQMSVWKAFRSLDPIAKGVTLGLLIVSVAGVSLFAFELWGRSRTYRLVLAAGDGTGESYILAKAIESVVEANLSRVSIEVMETGGTSDNLKRLDSRQADLVTAQADVPAGKDARTVAVLYSDSFQVVVQGNSGIQRFSELKGKRIGLAAKGGQYQSFLQVAEHFGLTEQDFTFVGEDDPIADVAFQQKQVDAVFRVRAIGNAQIAELIQSHGGRLIPIDQAEAMRVKHPAFEPTQIPKGAYQGKEPTVPATELSTIAVQRLLLAHSRIDADLLRQITQTLNENRRELKGAIPESVSNASPLVSNIRRPELTGGTGIPIHGGALAYYDRDEPSFLQANADYVGLILTLGLLMGSWLWELKRWMDRGRKDLADHYIEQVIDVMNACQANAMMPKEALTKIDGIFAQVAVALVEEGISQESFRTFNEAYKTVREVIDRKAI
jgi:uncharacterized protein